MNNDDQNIFDETVESHEPEHLASVPEENSVPPENISTFEIPLITEQAELLLEPPIILPALDTQAEKILLPNSKEQQARQGHIPTAIAFLIVGILVGSMFPVTHNKTKTPEPRGTASAVTSRQKSTQSAATTLAFNPIPTDLFENITLEAKAAYVWDINKREALYKKNADDRLPLASLAKIMTAVTVSDQVPRGAIVTIDQNALAKEGDTGLLRGEQWHLRDLLEFTLLVSSNDGAEALASVAHARAQEHGASSTPEFVEIMNQKAQEIGLTQTYFLNPSGLNANEHESGAYGSARDMARLFEYALKNIPDALEATTYSDLQITSLSGITHDAKNTNVLTNRIPGLIASKTGFTNLAGGNLVIAFEAGPGKQIVIAVLGSTYEGRFSDVGKLVSATLAHLENTENQN